MVAAFAAANVVGALLYGVRPHDPAVMAVAPLVLGAIALLACLAPVRGAMSVDAMSVLRQE